MLLIMTGCLRRCNLADLSTSIVDARTRFLFKLEGDSKDLIQKLTINKSVGGHCNKLDFNVLSLPFALFDELPNCQIAN